MDIVDYLPTMGFGGAAGLVVGYAAKKITKTAAFLLGSLFILLAALTWLGWVNVDWNAVQQTTEPIWSNPEGQSLVERAWDALMAGIPFGASFIAGFALGFKLG